MCLSAKRNTRAAISKLPVVCAEDSSLAPSVPQQAKWIQVCRSTQSGNMNSRYNSWPDYPEILGDDFRARCNSLYLQPLGSTTPSLRSTDYQVCHHFCLLKVFHWCPVSYSMPGECKACRGTQGEHTKRDMRQWIQQLRIWEVPLERILLLEFDTTLLDRNFRMSSVLCRSITSLPFGAVGLGVDS